jgi:hypothetical protein
MLDQTLDAALWWLAPVFLISSSASSEADISGMREEQANLLHPAHSSKPDDSLNGTI